MALKEAAAALHDPLRSCPTRLREYPPDGMTMLREHNKVLKVRRHCSSSAGTSALMYNLQLTFLMTDIIPSPTVAGNKRRMKSASATAE